MSGHEGEKKKSLEAPKKNGVDLDEADMEFNTNQQDEAKKLKQSAENRSEGLNAGLNKRLSPLNTPTKPTLKSTEKDQKYMITPETPEFKSSVRRELKFS